ncbi:hypothetical protein YC2023_002253 [Brassica napus]
MSQEIYGEPNRSYVVTSLLSLTQTNGSIHVAYDKYTSANLLEKIYNHRKTLMELIEAQMYTRPHGGDCSCGGMERLQITKLTTQVNTQASSDILDCSDCTN